MTYKEIIKLYRTGHLDEEQKKQVEKDIERQSAIGEYLFDLDTEELMQVEKISEYDNEKSDKNNVRMADEQSFAAEQDFTKFIKKSIRNTFIKTGAVVGAIVLAIVCFIVFAIPKIADARYYNPAKVVGVSSNGDETYRMSLDMAVYSELFLPGVYRDKIIVSSNGNAKYDICIPQLFSYSDNFVDVGGVVNKGQMLLYDNNIFKLPAINRFLPVENWVNDGTQIDENMEDTLTAQYAEKTQNTLFKELEKLNQTDEYMVYVTLSSVMKYDEFLEWERVNNVRANWCKLCFTNNIDKNTGEIIETEENEKTKYYALENIGFRPLDSCSELYFDEQKYPLLTQFSLSLIKSVDEDAVISENSERLGLALLTQPVGEDVISEADMTTHVCSLLRYFSEQEQFRNMMGVENAVVFYDELANDIENNGLNIYGFTMIADKEGIEALKDVAEIAGISISALKYE